MIVTIIKTAAEYSLSENARDHVESRCCWAEVAARPAEAPLQRLEQHAGRPAQARAHQQHQEHDRHSCEDRMKPRAALLHVHDGPSSCQVCEMSNRKRERDPSVLSPFPFSGRGVSKLKAL